MQRDNEELDGVEKRVDDGFKEVRGDIATLAEKFDAKFTTLDEKFDAKFAKLDEKFDAKFAKLDEKFDVKFDRLQTAMLQAVVGLAVSLSMIVAGILLTGSPG
jgi:hypothetical protein